MTTPEPPLQPLFNVPIAPQGSVLATQPAPKIYLLTFYSPPDNRLTPAFNAAFLTALDILEQHYPRGVVISTSGIAKFYSNGLDLDKVSETKGFFPDSMYPVWRRLLRYVGKHRIASDCSQCDSPLLVTAG